MKYTKIIQKFTKFCGKLMAVYAFSSLCKKHEAHGSQKKYCITELSAFNIPYGYLLLQSLANPMYMHFNHISVNNHTRTNHNDHEV
jgi:hypothetical protein